MGELWKSYENSYGLGGVMGELWASYGPITSAFFVGSCKDVLSPFLYGVYINGLHL